MADWSSEQYLKFKAQRTVPAKDLAAKAALVGTYQKVIDLGCGPGNSTAVLHSSFPNAQILGIDNSQNMIEKAKQGYPNYDFQLCDVHDIAGGYDLIFSNACLQWIPNHAALIPELMGKLNDGGVLAVQVPINGEEPLYRIIRDVVAQERWDFQGIASETNEACNPNVYFDILSAVASDFDIWETVYYHRMPSHEALLEWVKGTRLRPYLAALHDVDAQLLQQEILSRAKGVYPIMQNGEVILRFRRLFFLAKK